MTNQIETLIALSKEYTRLLDLRNPNSKSKDIRHAATDARLKRTGLILRQTMIDFEKGGMDND
ncbi:hypothetical protein DOS79_06500 [Staphylococcus felis]|uniref:Uncharacterized protein n=1 Tax=Staphylococcus felis TaxID=46127 RepID=A0A3E0IPE1_9STAP|nr:hypothetical protein [Staphylococcus felis]REH76193.1 hypothetical protein DOS59_08825 [Staphylococcus felis]REH83873.1 hypothetical protein DOS56_05305 [Staphylococcus felis]REH85293.1 hypothetical protein DOS63_05465 [Staphylococcus felis]REH94957.1 hypothetical protein DOS83_06945 [Staphylococcus felis]REH99013.1 hypothetical protein DOS64_10080 [Staphylococcus felis]